MKIFFNMLLKLANRLKALFLVRNYTVGKQSLSLAIGAYVAFCPFIGLHTLMMIVCAWVFSLNGPLMIAFSYAINNPWTMIPIYFFDYWIGVQIVFLAGLDGLPEPSFMIYLNNLLRDYFSITGISGWAFLIGGNVIGLIIGLITYIGAFLLLTQYHKQLNRS